MQRVLRSAALCLLPGTITAIALAWALPWWRPLPRDASMLVAVDGTGEYWMGPGERGPGWMAMTLYGGEAGLTEAGRALARPLPMWMDLPREGPLESRAVTAIGAGWPMIALRAEIFGVGHQEPPPGGPWHTGLGPQWVQWDSWRGALGTPSPAPGSLFKQRVVPIGVVALGLAADIAFWSLIWALPVTVIALRRAIRRWRGRCPRCGYDLQRDLETGCPECGWRRTRAVSINPSP